MKITKYSGSIVYNWILSYILILLVTIVLTGLVYSIAESTIETEINKSNRLVLSNIKNDIDSALIELNKFSIDLSMNQNIQDAYNLTQDTDGYYYTLYKAANSLADYKVFYKSLKGYYIFINQLQLVISPAVVNNSVNYFEGYIKSEDYTYDQWIDTMNHIHQGEYIMLPHHEAGVSDQKTLSLIRSFPITSRDKVSANIVIMLDFDNLLSNVTSDSSIIILDNGNNIIAHSDPEAAEIDYSELSGNSGILTKYSNNRKIVVLYLTSEQTKWKYVMITPEYIFWEKSEYIKNIMIGEIILCIFLVGFMSYYFIKRNYHPIQELIYYISKKLNTGSIGEKNEYNFIRQAINRTIAEKEQFESILSRQNAVLKENFIVSLLKGRDISMPVHEFVTSYNIAFEYDKYGVVVIYIDRIDKDLWEVNKSGNIDEYSLIRFVIKNVVEEIINRNSRCYIVEVDNILACVINTAVNNDDIKRILSVEINEAKCFIRENFKIDLTFAASSMHSRIEDLAAAYNEAVSAMEYSRIMEEDKTVFFSDIDAQSGKCYYYPDENIHKLTNYIKLADYDSANMIIEDIFNAMVINSISAEFDRFIVLNMAGAIIKTLSETEEERNSEFLESVDLAGQLMKCNTLVEMKKMMQCIVEKACDIERKRHESTDYKMKDTIRQIVADNYTDPGFGIGSIAEAIGKSPYYISRIYKDQTGEGILDLINRVRIEKAKELLKQDLTQELIAEKVGFTNVRTFQRVFKKIEGTTPGKLKV
jgi:AraC-like DNA-binding protein